MQPTSTAPCGPAHALLLAYVAADKEGVAAYNASLEKEPAECLAWTAALIKFRQRFKPHA